MISSDSENAKTYYHYVSDEQGSVSHIIRGEDKESGVSEQGREQDRILNQYEYDVFGNTISCKEQVENRFRYQCEQYDPITRQYYLRARYYNPVIGRFIQEDTYYGDGLNLYEYCRNNTITYKDPTGHNICATQRDLYHKYKEEGMNPQEAYQKMRKDLGLDSKSGYKDSGVGNGKDPWRSYESGRKTIDYIKLSDELGRKIENDGYKIIDIKDAAIANAEWADMGYDLPPVAAGTKVYNVAAGNFQYARVFKEGVNKPKSPFILRADDIQGLSAIEIAEKYALPQTPDKIVYPKIPSDVPLEISIVGPQKTWGTLGGDAQYAIKGVLLDDDWFTDIHDLK